MKLFHVEIERTIYVVAEDERDAQRVAEKYERDSIRDADADFVNAFEVTNAKTVLTDWLNSIPYGSNDDRTVAQILAAMEPPPFIDTKTVDMFAKP